MPKYTIEITFSTDRDLTLDELDNLESALFLQVNEPVDHDNQDETYETKDINIVKMKEEN